MKNTKQICTLLSDILCCHNSCRHSDQGYQVRRQRKLGMGTTDGGVEPVGPETNKMPQQAQLSSRRGKFH